ncbi:glycosyltransferase family 4 protein [Rickettsiales bacterium]|nr:glycosyltransferase family 4 protein [Rickettsiales bacterium]
MHNLDILLLVVGTACFIISTLGTRLALKILLKTNIMDIPSERSNHKQPVPRGGGAAIVDTIILGIIFSSIFIVGDFSSIWPILAALFLLSVVSFFDDIKGLSPAPRFLVQIISVAIGTFALQKSSGLLFGGFFPPLIDAIIVGFIWLWFLNLYNFMDGIDGLTASQTVCICVGIFLVSLFSGKADQTFFFYPVIIAASAIGFLSLNWHPAKIFMGDVGSVSLGFLLGWLLLKLAISGHYIESLIIPGYYLLDSGITISKRAFNHEKIWLPHSKHYYQQAVRNGKTHNHVVELIICCNIVLVLLAIFVSVLPGNSLFYVIAAIGSVAILLNYFKLPAVK